MNQKDENEFPEEFKNKGFGDFLNAARAQGILHTFGRFAAMIDAIEAGFNDSEDAEDPAKKDLIERMIKSFQMTLAVDYERFKASYKDELAMADAVLGPATKETADEPPTPSFH